MSSDDDTPKLPAELRFLKLLVTTLTAVMILGLLAIVWLLVTRLGAPPLPPRPDSVQLPDGAPPAAITFARDWLVVVTDQGTILLYPASGGAPVSTVTLP